MSGLNGPRETLAEHWGSLAASWDRLAGVWDDAVRREFEERHWREFQAAVPRALAALGQLDEIVDDALRTVGNLR